MGPLAQAHVDLCDFSAQLAQARLVLEVCLAPRIALGRGRLALQVREAADDALTLLFDGADLVLQTLASHKPFESLRIQHIRLPSTHCSTHSE